MVTYVTSNESSIYHAKMVCNVGAVLQELLLQGPRNEFHKDAPYIQQRVESKVMNQVVTAVTETANSQ